MPGAEVAVVRTPKWIGVFCWSGVVGRVSTFLMIVGAVGTAAKRGETVQEVVKPLATFWA